MLPPDPWDHKPTGGQSTPGREEVRPAATTSIAIDRLAVLLSPQQRPGTNDELARDLQLNDIAEQACLATGATGAAIALARGDEFICSASTGGTAPDLGVRLNIDQGLSAYCVHSGEVQRCDDSEIDSRVDAEVCRHLGVRSVLVVPIVYGEYLLGIFEIFSPQAFAFYDRDIQTVMVLSRSVLIALGISPQTIQPAPPGYPLQEFLQADSGLAEPRYTESGFDPPPDASWVGPNPRAAEELASVAEVSVAAVTTPSRPQVEETRVEHFDAASTREAEQFYPQFKIVQKPPRDIWTTILTVLVVCLALLLGWMLGHGHLARRNRAQEELRAGVASQQPGPAESTSAEMSEPPPTLELPPTRAQLRQSPFRSKVPKAVDGLVVYQDGRIIYRQGAAPRSPGRFKNETKEERRTASESAVEVSQEVASNLLTVRVEPHYPDRARLMNIQGPVVLQALINENGTVQQLKVLTGNADLAVAAIDAVRHWRFKPYTPKGKPSTFATRITVNFALPTPPPVSN